MTSEAVRELRQWLDDRGAGGLPWEEIDLEADRSGKVRRGAVAAARLRTALPYEDPYPLVTLLGRILRHFVWIDAARIVVVPVAPARHFLVIVDFHFYDPGQCFESPLVLSKLEGPGPTVEKSEAIDMALQEAVEGHADSLHSEEGQTFLRGFQAYCFSGISTHMDQEIAAFKALLPVELYPTTRDYRLLDKLHQEHFGILEAVERWIFRDRTSMEGRSQGTFIRPFPWVTLERGREVSKVPEVGGDAVVGRPDPGALLAIIGDETVPDGRKLDAFQELRSLPEEVAKPYLIRSAGHEGHRLDALRGLLEICEMTPFLREVVLTVELGRIVPALDRLRDYGIELRDPMAAWHGAAGDPDGDELMGALCQQSVLREYAATGDRSIIPALIREIEGGSRSDEWTMSALGMLRDCKVPEAAEVILGLTESSSLPLRESALEFFESVDFPPAVPALRAALHEEGLSTVLAAERGLAGQSSLETETFLGALALLDKRARRIPLDSCDEYYRKHLGAAIVRALASREEGGPQPRIIERVLQRTGVAGSQARPQASALPSMGGEADGDPDPLQTFWRRMELWRSPGHATEQYRMRGHRSPSWDARVEEAHERYDPAAKRLDADVARLYEGAIRAGCQDGMVHYRLAVCTHVEKGPESAIHHYGKASEFIPGQYPDSPYHLAAAEMIAEHHWREGRWGEARDVLRAALTGEMVTETSRGLLDRLETTAGLSPAAAGELPALVVGDLSPLPARHHRAAVTSVQICPNGEYLLSVDETGWVQVYTIMGDRELFGEACLRIGAGGPWHISWADPDGQVIVAGGPDGRILRCEFVDDFESRIQADLLLQHDSPVTAITGTGNGRFVFADDRGRLTSCDIEGGVGRPIPRQGKEVIRSLQRRYSHLVALAGASEVEAWSLEVNPSPVCHQDLSRFGRVEFVDIGAPGLLYVLAKEGGVVTLSLATGACEQVVSPGRGPEDIRFARWSRLDGIVVWANRGICIQVEDRSGEGTATIVCNMPLEAFDVSFEERIIAHSDSTHEIGIHRMAGSLFSTQDRPPEETT